MHDGQASNSQLQTLNKIIQYGGVTITSMNTYTFWKEAWKNGAEAKISSLET